MNMKKLLKNSDVIGGIFGAVAIAAAVAEVVLNGFDGASVAGGIKDIAGTVMTVLLMITAIRVLIPRKEKETFVQQFDRQVKQFVAENGKMLFQKENGNADFYEIYMQTDFGAYFGKKPSLQPGWFMRMPVLDEAALAKGDIPVHFHMNQGTFFGHQKPADEAKAYQLLGDKLVGLLQSEYDSSVVSQYDKARHIVAVTVKKPLTQKEDIAWFVEILKKVYASFPVLGDSGITDEMIK